MPEGPEVKIVSSQLNRSWRNWTLTKINILGGPYQSNNSQKYRNFRDDTKTRFVKSVVTDIKSKGKVMYWELMPEVSSAMVVKDYLVFRMGMTGGFRFDKTGDSVKLEFTFTKTGKNRTVNKKVHYIDQRNFGTFTFMRREKLNETLNDLGPTVVHMAMTPDEFTTRFKNKSIQKHEIAKALLNQKVVSGIGNYLRAEILYAAGVSPMAKVKDLDEKQLLSIYEAIKTIVGEVMAKKGSPDYKDTNHNSGTYEFKVYKQINAPDGTLVRKTKLASRTIYHI
jgi:DNA-formamidopyrimidine glycosylase